MKALTAARLASWNIGASPAVVRSLWEEYIPDIPLSDTRWFEKYETRLVKKGMRIAADNRKNGKRFKANDEKHVGKYVIGIIRNLKAGKRVERIGPFFPVKAEFCFESDYRITPADHERFARKLTAVGACLLFGDSSTTNTYPRFSVAGRSVSAHFFAFFAKLGYLPRSNALGGVNGLHVAHTCGKRSCCRPEHLRLMTKGLNLKERKRPAAADPVKPFHCVSEGDYGTTDAMPPGDTKNTSFGTSIDESLGHLPHYKPVTNPKLSKRLSPQERTPKLSSDTHFAGDVRNAAPPAEVNSAEGDITI